MASEVDSAAAQQAGLRFLIWLNSLDASSEKQLAVNISTSAMRKALGQEKYNETLASDVIARQVAAAAGRPVEVHPAAEESVSVLGAMRHQGQDQSAVLASQSPSLRAREAAAHGFASGRSGDRHAANRYFDIAYSALDEVWAGRTPEKDATAVVEEVNQAAANVDPVSAMARAQKLQAPSAQAIGMLAVARVMLGRKQ